jgi:hypothetical protein
VEICADGQNYITFEGGMVVDVTKIRHSGIGLGTALAVAISWSVNKSILWAMLHGIFSWFYVIYYAITR